MSSFGALGIVAQDGFQWGDAAIGAVAALGLVFVILGSMLAIRYGRRRWPAETSEPSVGLMPGGPESTAPTDPETR